MDKTGHASEGNNAARKRKIVATSGEIFPDGSAIELVTTCSLNGDYPALLCWDGNRAVIGSEIEHHGQIYQPIKLHSSILKAISFAHGTAEYGTTRRLFLDIAKLLEDYIGLSGLDAQRVSAWIATTWFPDCLSSPPVLSVSALDIWQAITIFRLLRCLCRRGLILTELSRAALCSMPMLLRPTLLLNQPGLSPKLRGLCRASNFRGVFLPAGGGQLLEVACSKAIFAQLGDPADLGAIHLTLLPSQRELPSLGEHEEARIARRFQPRLLLYRLRHLRKVRESRFAATELTFPTRELARNLGACIQDDPELALQVGPLLRGADKQARMQRYCDPDVAIIEVLWALLHPMATGAEIRVEELTRQTNTVLRCRGEIREHSPEEIGKRLTRLGLNRHRRAGGMAVLLCRETSRRVHQLARSFAVGTRVSECPDCKEFFAE